MQAREQFEPDPFFEQFEPDPFFSTFSLTPLTPARCVRRRLLDARRLAALATAGCQYRAQFATDLSCKPRPHDTSGANRHPAWYRGDLDILAIERETVLSSLETARQALVTTGIEPEQAARAVEIFLAHDRNLLDSQCAVRQDKQRFIQTTSQAAAQLQELFEADVKAAARTAPVARDRP